MKLVKLAILVCGLGGLASLGFPMTGGQSNLMWLLDTSLFQLVLVVLAFGMPVLMAAIAIARPPLQPWQALASTAGFGLGVAKTHAWQALPNIAILGHGAQLAAIAVAGGLVASLVALIKPER